MWISWPACSMGTSCSQVVQCMLEHVPAGSLDADACLWEPLRSASASRGPGQPQSLLTLPLHSYPQSVVSMNDLSRAGWLRKAIAWSIHVCELFATAEE